MLSPAFQVLEINPSFFERAISLSSSCVICSLIILGLPRMSFLQARQYTLDLLGILKTTSVNCQNSKKDLRLSTKKSNIEGIIQSPNKDDEDSEIASFSRPLTRSFIYVTRGVI